MVCITSLILNAETAVRFGGCFSQMLHKRYMKARKCLILLGGSDVRLSPPPPKHQNPTKCGVFLML